MSNLKKGFFFLNIFLIFYLSLIKLKIRHFYFSPDWEWTPLNKKSITNKTRIICNMLRLSEFFLLYSITTFSLKSTCSVLKILFWLFIFCHTTVFSFKISKSLLIRIRQNHVRLEYLLWGNTKSKVKPKKKKP